VIRTRAAALNIDVRIVPGLSFLEVAYAALGIDPAAGLQIASAFEFQEADPILSNREGLLIGQVFAASAPQERTSTRNIELVDVWLRKRFPLDHPISIVWTAGMPDYQTEVTTVPLSELASRSFLLKESARLAALFVPPRL
jgi:tetrapyrrole methylase family protein/MazG family protein